MPNSSDRRAGYRVHYVLPLHVRGTDANGKQFSSTARSEILTRDGGLIVCPVSLTPGARVVLISGEKQARVRIVGAIRPVDDSFAYGIAFLDDHMQDFWEVHLPQGPAAGVGRTVLECSRCHTSSAAELGEIEIVVLEEVSVVGRFCDQCSCETLWEVPKKLADTMLVTGSAAYSMPTKATEKRQRTREDRQHRRIALKRASACIKQRGKSDDIVTVLDVSRGGMRFTSTVDYQPDAQIEVAVPYTEGGANIFMPAKIIRVVLRAKTGMHGEYACRYEVPS